MTSNDLRKAARYQEQYKIEHETGYKISRFITVVVKPKDNNETELECYMVSDLGQAIERDGVLVHSDIQKIAKARQAKKGEIVPTVYMENKPVFEFDPDFLIVNVIYLLIISFHMEHQLIKRI